MIAARNREQYILLSFPRGRGLGLSRWFSQRAYVHFTSRLAVGPDAVEREQMPGPVPRRTQGLIQYPTLSVLPLSTHQQAFCPGDCGRAAHPRRVRRDVVCFFFFCSSKPCPQPWLHDMAFFYHDPPFWYVGLRLCFKSRMVPPPSVLTARSSPLASLPPIRSLFLYG